MDNHSRLSHCEMSFLHTQEILLKLNICQKVGYIPLRTFFCILHSNSKEKIVLFSMSHFSFQYHFPFFWKKEQQGFSLIKIQSNIYFSSKAIMHVKRNGICSHSFALHFLINLNLHSQEGHVMLDRHG